MSDADAGIVALGLDTYVLASQIVAVHEHVETWKEVEKLAFDPFSTHRSTVLLRNGAAIPAYKTARTIRLRWVAALDMLRRQSPL